ncbi:toprim domain-containing protein [Rubripirellula reticaptiva]|uniref:DNA topoisomerase (ATP-hydrolyzing) n=1 Tax=Rubripirellula reticaptiva TaxID=2528013 RepID=A0A5C6EF65_9BACT|nr:toprim domain-containing protein [Rubripirellula reticaptiva]TWU48423.1 DNA gyrase subunit B [Rubripirellula reticaptiva]
MFRIVPVKLHDCQSHGVGSGAELFIVEGDSASKSVVRARRSADQAVLPMQGKPLNAYKARKSVVARNELFGALVASIGVGWGESLDLSRLRYDRIIMLFDPDADGIHCGALMSMFFYRFMRPLLDSGRICVARAPLYEITSPDSDDVLHAYNEDHYAKIRVALDAKGVRYSGQRYRGLASMNESALVATCIDPATRTLQTLAADDAEAAIRIFCGGE